MKNEKIEEIEELLNQMFSGIVPMQTAKMMLVMAIASLKDEAYEQGKKAGADEMAKECYKEVRALETTYPLKELYEKDTRKQLLDEIIDDLSLIADMRKKISCKKNDIFDDVIKFIKSKHL